MSVRPRKPTVSTSARERFEEELERARIERTRRIGNPYAALDQCEVGVDSDQVPDFTGDGDFDDILRECMQVMNTKGVDYAAGSEDRLYNFRQAAADLDTSMEVVLYTYLWKHLSAIRRHCRGEDLRSESLRDRIVDAINYLLILYKIDREGKNSKLHAAADHLHQLKRSLSGDDCVARVGSSGHARIDGVWQVGDHVILNIPRNEWAHGKEVVLTNELSWGWEARYVEDGSSCQFDETIMVRPEDWEG